MSDTPADDDRTSASNGGDRGRGSDRARRDDRSTGGRSQSGSGAPRRDGGQGRGRPTGSDGAPRRSSSGGRDGQRGDGARRYRPAGDDKTARPSRDGQWSRDGQRGRDGQRSYDGQRSHDGGAPRRDSGAPRRDGGAPRRDGAAPRRDGDAPRRGGSWDSTRAHGNSSARGVAGGRDRSGASGGRPTGSGGGKQGRGRSDDKLWTKGGRPARGDRDARDHEYEVDPETALARELRSVRPRHDDPDLPADVEPRDLPKEARVELKTLSKDNADWVAQHLVMTSRLIESDPELAHRHALSAARRAGRIGVVRETLAITAYATGDFALALRELRTYRRITGSNDQIALMVDSERGVGRPDRALELGRSVDRSALPTDVKVSLAIAMSGARLDLGQDEAALAELEIPQLDPNRAFSWSPDLFHAYAEVLEALGRDADSATWRERAERAELALEDSHADAELETIQVIEEELESTSDETDAEEAADQEDEQHDGPVSTDD